VRPLTLTSDEFASLAAGGGSESAIAKLIAGQLAKRRLLIWGVVRDAREQGLPVEEPVELLLRVHAQSSAVLDDVLLHPQVDAWAAEFPRTRAVGYLSTLAAAAAIRAGLSFSLRLRPVAGVVTLPGLGSFAAAGDPATLVFDGHTLTNGGAPAMLRSPRIIDLTELGGPTVAIEDTDPHRDQYRMPVVGRFTQADRFAALWREAWALLAAEFPGHARATRMFLRSFVPLVPSGDGTERSASSGRASGAIALALPRTATSMALLVLHETQHLKLHALLDLIDLTTAGGRRRYHAPWRGDPRPIRGLLQGTYAHLGVTEFWRSRRARQFAYWRRQTGRAAATLADSGELTAAGARFVDGIRATLAGWAHDPVGAADLQLAEVCTTVNDLHWRLAHRSTPADVLSRLVTAWLDGSARPGGSGVLRAGSSAEARILAAVRTDRPDLPAGDRLLLAGKPGAAADEYAHRIAKDATDDDWAGLAAALGGCPQPEVPRDLYRALLPGRPDLDPRDVLRWWAGAG